MGPAWKILAIGLFLISTFVYGATPSQIPESTIAPAEALSNAFASVADHLKGTVVSILSEKMVKSRNQQFPFPFEDPFFRRFFGVPPQQLRPRQVPISGLGSGFILDEKGHVLTNDHVVKGMEKIHVILPNRESFEATVLGSDSKTDIAVLQIKGSFPKDLPVAQLGDSDQLKAGHLVLAFGAPFGLTHTVTHGIISATGRSNVGIADFEDFIQTDAPINPGNSGGPLVNMRGEVIGINTAIATRIGQSAGVGFAIPINMAKEILPTLLQGKKVVRGMLGIGVQDITPPLQRQFNLPNTKGALVSQVTPGSPADKAGIKTGDVIVKFGGKSIEDSRQLREMVASTAPGTRKEVNLNRNGKQIKVTADLGELRPEAAAPQNLNRPTGGPLKKFGIEAKTLTPELQSQLNLFIKKGIVITDVDELSPAGLAGLRPGDVITEVDRKSVENVNQANQILAKSKNPNEALFLINHKGESVYVTLETG